MHPISVFATVLILGLTWGIALPQSQGSPSDEEQLKIMALQSLVTAPEEKSLPIVTRVVRGSSSNALKSRALFVLSQIDHPDAQALLHETASSAGGELRLEAVRMIGISGNSDSLQRLGPLYENGDEDLREAVLNAYMIAGDTDAIFEIAVNAEDEATFERAVTLLGSMGAHEELRQLGDRPGAANALIQAWAMSGDLESLQTLALDASDPERQQRAINAIGLVGGGDSNALLLKIYHEADTESVRTAALNALYLGGEEAALLDLYAASTSVAEKHALLQMLISMGSDEAWALVEQALGEDP